VKIGIGGEKAIAGIGHCIHEMPRIGIFEAHTLQICEKHLIDNVRNYWAQDCCSSPAICKVIEAKKDVIRRDG